MNNILGPYDSAEWETLLMLRKAIGFEQKNNIGGEMLERDIAAYNILKDKAA